MPITGRCLCGAVRVEIDAQPLGVRACWCTVCQQLAAGSATVNLVFPAEAVAVDGEVRWYESIADSGNTMRRGFCPACGTPLFSRSEQRPTVIIVRAGVLDDPEIAAPEATIWTGSAPAWALIDPELPGHAGQLPPLA